VAVAAAALVGVVGVAVGVAVLDGDDTSSSSAGTAQLADVRQACLGWMNSQGAAQPATTWCENMTGWMGRQMADGSMMGSMMWGNAEQMLATCRAWMAADPASGAPAAWCDEMMQGTWPDLDQEWSGHMGGPMMGG
jgi:hypothetical protein